MSGRRSAAVDAAVQEVRRTFKAFRQSGIRLTPGVRRQTIKDQAVLSGVHKVTLFRALGYYTGKTNGTRQRNVGPGARRTKRPSA